MKVMAGFLCVLGVMTACGGAKRTDEFAGSSSGGASSGGASSGNISSSSGSSGIPIGMSSCSTSAECILRPKTCCGTCGAYTESDVVAIRASSAKEYESTFCAGEGCPACYTEPNPLMYAACEAGTCVVKNLKTSTTYTGCARHSDCVLRAGSRCCTACDARSFVAFAKSKMSEFTKLVCEQEKARNGDVGCADCVPPDPALEGIEPRCVEGVCVARTPRE